MQKVFQFVFYPFTNRVKLGEGGIVAFNILHAWFATHSFLAVFTHGLVSLLTLCALYGYNDYIDRFIDAHNKKKDQQFVSLVTNNANLFLWLNILLSAALVAAAYFFIGSHQAIALLLLFFINAAYSNKLKATPLIDIVAVVLWGALFIMISTGNYLLAALAGVMTGIAHVFQMLDDKDVDEKTKTSTSVVAIPGIERWLLVVLSLVLSIMLSYWIGKVWCFTALLPIIVFLILQKVSLSWYIARLYFAVMWVVVLYKTYGGL